jgi:hypothetical protein
MEKWKRRPALTRAGAVLAVLTPLRHSLRRHAGRLRSGGNMISRARRHHHAHLAAKNRADPDNTTRHIGRRTRARFGCSPKWHPRAMVQARGEIVHAARPLPQHVQPSVRRPVMVRRRSSASSDR